MKVKIPFLPQFKDPMLDGQKVMTTRSKKYGNIGDTFEAFGEEFIITSVFKLSLGHIAVMYHKEEGFKSKQDFIKLWKKLHPRVGYVPERIYWVHVFGPKLA